ncbi:MAG: prepilin-type N-terminal cleavage/methylation domain-containing protein [Pseudomonadota bacterium]
MAAMADQAVKVLMRILAAGISDRQAAQRGLTLVELLIVIAIMGLMAGVVVLTVRPQAPIERFAAALERDLIAMRNEAVIGSTARGLYVDEGRLHVLEISADGWRVASSADIPKGLDLELRLTEEFVLPEHRDNFDFPLPDDDDKDVIEPQVTFGSLGEVTPFSLSLAATNEVRVFTVDQFGALEVTRER